MLKTALRQKPRLFENGAAGNLDSSPRSIRTALLHALANLGLDASVTPASRIIRRYNDSEYLATARISRHMVEFGLLERQGEVTVNILYCSLGFDAGLPVSLWVVSDSEPQSNGSYQVRSFDEPILQRVLQTMREALE